jgi:hypothetical protein
MAQRTLLVVLFVLVCPISLLTWQLFQDDVHPKSILDENLTEKQKLGPVDPESVPPEASSPRKDRLSKISEEEEKPVLQKMVNLSDFEVYCSANWLFLMCLLVY